MTERLIIADNQPLTALAVETICRRQQEVFGNGAQMEIVYATNKTELGALLKEGKRSAIVIDYTLYDFVNQENLTMMCDLYRNTSTWLLLSDELTPDFLRYVLYQTSNVGVAYKDAPLSILRESLTYVMRGERYVAQQVELEVAEQVATIYTVRAGGVNLEAMTYLLACGGFDHSDGGTGIATVESAVEP